MPAAITDSCSPYGYSATHFFPERSCRGVSIVHDDSMKIGKLALDFQASSFEYACIKLTSGSGLLNVIGIYRPGSIAPTSVFFDEFIDFLARVNSPPGKTVLSEDFNCPGLSLNEVDERLIEVTDLVNLTICDSTSTRMNHDGSPGNRLDLIMHNAAPDEIGDLKTFDVGFSDHLLVTASMSFTRTQPDVLSFLCRNLKRIDYTNLENQLFDCSLIKDPASTVDEYVEQLHRDSEAVLNRAAPLHSTTNVLESTETPGRARMLYKPKDYVDDKKNSGGRLAVRPTVWPTGRHAEMQIDWSSLPKSRASKRNSSQLETIRRRCGGFWMDSYIETSHRSASRIPARSVLISKHFSSKNLSKLPFIKHDDRRISNYTKLT